MNETINNVVVEGKLAEVDINTKTYVKDGKNVESIGGSFKVKTSETIDGVTVDLEVPIFVFANKEKVAGGLNPSYENIEKVMTEYKSIAAVGEQEADCVRITRGRVSMNEYFPSNGGPLVSYPRINASFINKIKEKDCSNKAIWEMILYIAEMDYLIDTDGTETDEFIIKGISVAYNGAVSIIPIMTKNRKIAEAIKTNYEAGDTVPFSGKVNFTSKTVTFKEEVEIGDPIEKTRTENVSELIITGVRSALEEGLATEDIKKGIAERTKRLEETKNKQKPAGNGEFKAPRASDGIDLGF